MPKHKAKPRLTQADKSAKIGLARLKKAGLYKPERPRAAPTKYAKSLLGKFRDFLSGQAGKVKVTGSKPRDKGYKTAREYASGDRPGSIRSVRNIVIVPKLKGEHVSYSRKTKSVRVIRTVGKDRYIRQPFKDVGRKGHRSIDKILSQLKPGDKITVPLYRGRRGVEWTNYSPEEFKDMYNNHYFKRYDDLLDFVELFRLEGPSFK